MDFDGLPTRYVQKPTGTAGLLKIGDEIMRFSHISAGANPETWLVNNLERGLYGTVADEHDAGDTAQAGVEWIDAKPWEVIRDLLTGFADVPSSWIDTDDWSDEHDRWLLTYDEITGAITDPAAVEEIIGNIAESVMIFLWADVEAKRIRMRAVRPVDEEIIDLSDELEILAGTLDRRVEMAEQTSRASVHFNLIDGADDLEDPKNFRNTRVVLGEEFGQPRPRRIVSPWLKTDGQALQTVRTLVLASGGLPIYITAEVGANRVDQIKPGSVVRLSTRILQDDTGARVPTLFIVVEAQETPARRLKLTMRTIGAFPAVWEWADNSAEEWPDGQGDGHGYWTGTDGLIEGENPRRFWN